MNTSHHGGKVLRGARVILPVVAVALWLIITAVGGQTFGKVSDVISNDQTTFLPADAESTLALEVSQEFSDDDAIPATVVAEPTSGQISDQDLSALQSASADFAALGGTVQVLPPRVAEDRAAAQILVLIEERAVEEGAVDHLRDAVQEQLPSSDWTAHVTGPAALSDDFAEAFAGIDGILLVVAVVTVFTILVLVYRSVMLPFLVLLSSVAALCAAIVVIYQMAQLGWIQLNGQAQGILSILVIGAATDYSLLLVARYREELMQREDRFSALWQAWRRSLGAIVASGGTVAVGLLSLLFSDLNSNRALGPVASAGIVFAMIATLTFLPALLALLGRPVFWPKTPRATASAVAPARRELRQQRQRTRLWTAAASAVRRRPRTIWIVVTLVLLGGSAGVLDLRAEGVPQSELVLGETDAKSGQQMLERHFDAGTGAPTNVYAPADEAEEAISIIDSVEGVGEAYLVSGDGSPASSPAEAAEAAGYVEISVTLTDPGDSLAAEHTVRDLRQGLDGLQGQALTGGTTATQLDTNATAQDDLRTIIPIVLAVILVFLVVLLRALVAPVLLLVTTVLSYLAALGISALVFNYVFGFPGADPAVPLFGFVFLTALGVDYSIFLTTRAREETPRRGAPDALLHSLVVTGGVITSAGVVLAATFAALAVLPLMFMVQLAFLVSIGVLIDTLVVRTLLIPALGVDLGPRFWWPSRLGRQRTTATVA